MRTMLRPRGSPIQFKYAISDFSWPYRLNVGLELQVIEREMDQVAHEIGRDIYSQKVSVNTTKYYGVLVIEFERV